MLATLISEPFDDKEWIFEIKWDGYRAIAECNSHSILLYSRTLHSFNYPPIIRALKELKINAILDGEIVALDEKGKPSFQLIQNAKNEQIPLHYYVFDILYLDGQDIRTLPLIERKRLLQSLLKQHPSEIVHYTDHIEKQGKAFFQLCVQQGLEGIIGKNKTSLYLEGTRSKEWVKIKSHLRQEVVIGGFTQPKGGRKNFGALVVGVYKGTDLQFVGHVGGGFNEHQLQPTFRDL